ncbi:hypothetical protein F4806DRAFT_231998 [Annulohypoxylon nitens]|nr:hypothetical protein F4806DRAFT_231998 [Annulohypoxylon nitens]
MYGCQNDLMDTVRSRLLNCRLNTFHPLTLPVLFADIERNRHVGMVERYVSKLLERVLNMGILTQRSTPEARSECSEFGSIINGSSSPIYDRMCVLDWLEISHIRDGLQNWQTQLGTLVQHFDELENILYKSETESSTENISHGMKSQGARIQDRLTQIINEYDEKIRSCSTVIDGMTFATQTEWNHIARTDTQTTLRLSSLATEISKATQRDGSQMRTIALMTMVFLPGTFVATLFSMTFFDWKLKDEEMISSYIWIYVVSTVILTVATIGTWYYFTGKVQINRRYLLPS